MTKIETLFGGVLALGIFAVFAFVFFGSAEPRERTASATYDAPRARSYSAASMNGLMSENGDDYVAPATACECYYLGYDMMRNGFDAQSVEVEGQARTCLDKVGRDGSAAFSQGAVDATEEPRARRSCPVAQYF